MKGKRTRLYAAVIGALVLALLLRPSAKPEIVQGAQITRIASPPAPVVEALAIRERRIPAMPPALFASPAPPPPAAAAPPPPVLELPPVVPEVRILGWMQSGPQPYVFVEWERENYSLLPTQMLGESYRFDGIEEGMAEFTYLPDGTTRQYAVSDVTTVVQ